MNFESGFRPESQESAFNPEAAREMESSILQKFTGKAKLISRVLIMTSMLTLGAGVFKEASAGENASKDSTEQVENKAGGSSSAEKTEINRNNLTASGMYAENVVLSARIDMEKVETSADANTLVRTHLNNLVSEFFEPTKGDVKEGAYGVRVVDRSQEDALLWEKSANEMKQIIEELNKDYGIEAFEKRISQINTIIEKLKKEASYSYQTQKKMMEEAEKELGK